MLMGDTHMDPASSASNRTCASLQLGTHLATYVGRVMAWGSGICTDGIERRGNERLY